MGLRWEFARRFAEKIGKLTGNTSGDRRKKIIRLATRMPEAIGLTGLESLNQAPLFVELARNLSLLVVH
ncbi:hypothetical protein B296_00046988 [Ensete ventricosum]|uniref:Uncharacterized protein n=1 Tax=Ensete ventricosum TaxID=4639 RepID=A0A426X2F5_ENSVE|nr:hypothetical protein B296_00046988 [Ensete ventricosum]